MIKGNENLEKSKRLLNEDIKTYIREAVKEQVHNETNRKVYYEYELIKSYNFSKIKQNISGV